MIIEDLTIKQAKALEILKKHFIFKLSEETEKNGEVWLRMVSIQAKEDEGTYDTSAYTNLVDYKEDFEALREALDNA